jgi:xanthine dehydrogenase large subunit
MADRTAQPPRTRATEVHRPLPHDSADLHVAGAASYVDDLPEPPGLLHCAFGHAAEGHASLVSLDLEAVRAAPGVVAVFTAADIPGENNVGPVVHDEPLLAESEIIYPGQPLFLVAATSTRAARRAARLGKAAVEPRPALVTIADAQAAGSEIEPTQYMRRGDADAALAAAPHRLTGRFEMGGQEHFYLEGQAALATPGEQGQLHILSSTQHPSEIQHLIAKLLGRSHAEVVVEVRRMGGGFGGKETQAAAFAAAAALVAAKTGRPAKFRADRDDDMVMTGKRHDFTVDYDVGFDGDGRIEGAASSSPRAAAPLPTSRRRSTTAPCSTPTTLLFAGRRDRLAAAADQHRLQHRLSRLRRAAGDDGDRAGDGRDRLCARPRPARVRTGNLYGVPAAT